ncbi:MAG: hypothetical protein ABIP35_00310 [Ginsengibacter sp.]
MKQKTQTIIFAAAKKYVAFSLMLLATLRADAQHSGLTISVASKAQQIAAMRGGISPTTATLRKVKKVVNDIAEATKKMQSSSLNTPTTEKKVVDQIPQTFPTSPVITSATIYDIKANTAPDQYTSLQANFVFTFYNTNNALISGLSEIIELYKLEKGAITRSFCIPAGNCKAINIPIQISDNASPDIHGTEKGAGAGKSTIHHITIPSGYLSAGEYAFIDKSTLSADGTALVCFAFTVL